MRKELEPKCVPQWFLELLLGTRQSALSQFFSLSQVTIRKSTWPSLLLISKVANYPTFLGVSLIRQQCVQNIQDRYERLTAFQRFDGSQVFVCLFIYLLIYLLILNYNWLTFPFKVADQQAAVFGQCCFDVGDVNCTMGTGSFIDINTGSYPHASVAGNSKLRNLLFTGLQLLRWPPHGLFAWRYSLI